MTQNTGWPDGLAPEHFKPTGLFPKGANPLPALGLAALLAVALSGILGGGPESTYAAESEMAALCVEKPAIIRNGEFFETRIAIEARQPIAELKLLIDTSLWRGMSQNSMIPQASDETTEDGRYVYSFGPLDAGKSLLVQFDTQSNPTLLGSTEGSISVADGDTELVTLPLSVKVLP